MTIMVRAVITISDHWIIYAELYEMGSTDAGSWGHKKCFHYAFPKTLEQQSFQPEGQEKGLQVDSTGECGVPWLQGPSCWT